MTRFVFDMKQLPPALIEKLEGHEAHGAVTVRSDRSLALTLVARKLPGAEWGSVVANSHGIVVIFFDKTSNMVGKSLDVLSIEDGVDVLLRGPVADEVPAIEVVA